MPLNVVLGPEMLATLVSEREHKFKGIMGVLKALRRKGVVEVYYPRAAGEAVGEEVIKELTEELGVRELPRAKDLGPCGRYLFEELRKGLDEERKRHLEVLSDILSSEVEVSIVVSTEDVKGLVHDALEVLGRKEECAELLGRLKSIRFLTLKEARELLMKFVV